MPTLFVKGKLQQAYREKQEVLDTYVPIEYIIEWFEDRIPETLGGKPKILPTTLLDRILIIQSSTGSGKSTVMPQELFHNFQARTDKIIGITQPRVLTAMEIPVDVMKYNTKEALASIGKPNRTPLELGVNIGYKTGAFKNAPAKGIVYMTSGVLQQQFNVMSDEQIMNTYSIIIIDEAHDKSIGTISVLYSVKKFIQRNITNPACPFLILTTATFDTIAYSDYMFRSIPKSERYQNIIKVSGTSQPITEQYLDYNSSNYVETIKKLVITIQKDFIGDITNADQVSNTVIKQAEEYIKRIHDVLILGSAEDVKVIDIMIFVSGKEIMELEGPLIKANDRVKLLSMFPVKPIQLKSADVQTKSINFIEAITKPADTLKMVINGKSHKVSRKAIIATNVAETGLTIESLKFVIDLGWVQGNYFVPTYNSFVMIRKPVSQDMHTQRRGRVGRGAPGFCYNVFTEDTFHLMKKEQYSELFISDITIDWLQFMVKEIDEKNISSVYSVRKLIEQNFIKSDANLDVLSIDILDPPPPDMIWYVLEKLFVLGFITSNSIPTYAGLLASKTRRSSAECIRMILAGYIYKVPIIYLISLAAIIDTSSKLYLEDTSEIVPNVMFLDSTNTLYIRGLKHQKLYFAVGDDNIFSLLIFLYIIKDPLTMREKCEKHKISYNNILGILERRDEIILNLGSIGLNPFMYHRDLTSYRSVVEFSKDLKQCIYEGYKMNMLLWNAKSSTYIDRRTGMSIDVKNPLIYTSNEIQAYNETNPYCILYYSITFKQDRRSIIYQPGPISISILDGYTEFDPHYDYMS